MASRPDPSLLVFISTIPQLPPLFKIRFIGCITSYDLNTGFITLTHKPSNHGVYDDDDDDDDVEKEESVASSSIMNVLKSKTKTKQGINTNTNNDNINKNNHKKKKEEKEKKPKTSNYSIKVSINLLLPSIDNLTRKEWMNVIGYTQIDGTVQAITMWKAENLDLGRYEKALRNMISMREEEENEEKG